MGVTNLCAAGGHHHLHFGAAFDQPAHQVRTLVGGDAAGDAEQDSSLRRQWMPFSSLKRAISLSNCLLMVASSVRFSRRFSSCVRMSLRDAHQILGHLIGHGRRLRIVAVGLEAHAGRAQLFQFPVEYLEELAGDLDLIRHAGSSR